MKAILISRPGDFGILEDHWAASPLELPLPGGTVLELHAASLRLLGITDVRVLRCHPAGRPTGTPTVEEALTRSGLNWSVRPWPVGPWPEGWTLNQALDRQRLFLAGDDALIFSVPVADPRGWVGPKVPTGFPTPENRALSPWKLRADGSLDLWEGPSVSLAGSRDFYRSSLRLLETLPPPALVLRGIHRQANLEPPLSLGAKIHAASRSRLGPLVQLAAGSRLEPGATLARTLVLTPTTFSRDQAVDGKIVIGHNVIEPVRGDVVALG